MKIPNLTRGVPALVIALLFSQLAFAQNGPGGAHWVSTWATAQQQPGFGRGGPGGAGPGSAARGCDSAAASADSGHAPARRPQHARHREYSQ